MELTDIDVQGFGSFDADEPAGFTIERLNLPSSWDYIYQNRKLLLRVDQFGMSYAAAYPPSDIVLFMRDRHEKHSVWPTWLASPRFERGPFTNFFRPCPGIADPALEPARVEIRFAPHRARYLIEHEGLRVVTELFVPADEPTLCQRVTVTNLSGHRLPLALMPALRHFAQWGAMAPWDKPEWYTRTAFVRAGDGTPGFSVHVTSPTCVIAKRRGVALWSSSAGLAGAEVSYERFVGAGTFQQPESVLRGCLSLSSARAGAWGEYHEDNNLFAYPQICALHYAWDLEPGESRTLRQVLAWIPLDAGGGLGEETSALRPARLLDPGQAEAEMAGRQAAFARLTAARGMSTPDRRLDRFVNEWLPLQLDWACSLDRGWPTGMRGGRDAANDFTALVPYDPAYVRAMVLTELSCQRPDGWVPRHFSARGHAGTERDTRSPADAGAVVLEMAHEYLAWTRDLDLLAEQLPWLDQPAGATDSVLEHLLRIAVYYLDPDNLGEHGLCKVREGGWLDALNQAGLKGRGEDVMLSCQVVHGLDLLSEIAVAAAGRGLLAPARAEDLTAAWRAARIRLRDCLRRHAFNRLDYFSGFFNDEGRWLFGPEDPDGEARIYGPANAWALIAGVAAPDLVEPCLAALDRLRCEAGYLLHAPPFTRNHFLCGGRMTSGDSPAGRSEHGNPYNHGSHGFLARGAAVAGRGALVLDALRWLLPYDQERHPVRESLRPPYAVINVWEAIPSFRNRGKDTFLTGSTAYGLRIAYAWMLGIRPAFDGLVLDPCLSPEFPAVEAAIAYLGRHVRVRIANRSGLGCGVRRLTVNGQAVATSGLDPCSGRPRFMAPDRLFDRGENLVEVEV